MADPLCECGHSIKEHACGTGRCFAQEQRAGCRCGAFASLPAVVVAPRNVRMPTCPHCGQRHVGNYDLPWCKASERQV